MVNKKMKTKTLFFKEKINREKMVRCCGARVLKVLEIQGIYNARFVLFFQSRFYFSFSNKNEN